MERKKKIEYIAIRNIMIPNVIYKTGEIHKHKIKINEHHRCQTLGAVIFIVSSDIL